jgi:hypothetical protein
MLSYARLLKVRLGCVVMCFRLCFTLCSFMLSWVMFFF